MAEGGGPGGGGAPDWVVIGGVIATVLTAAGGVAAGMRGAFAKKGNGNGEEQRRALRDTTATANASLTLESVFRLVNELQEEVGRKSLEITGTEQRCEERMNGLLRRIGELEREVRELRRIPPPLELLKE